MHKQENLSPLKEEKIKTAIQKTREEMEYAIEELPELKMRLAKNLAYEALGENNHVQVARIKRKISEIEETITNAIFIIQGLKQITAQKQV